MGQALPVGRKVTKGLSVTSDCCAPAAAARDAATIAAPNNGECENRSTTRTPKREWPAVPHYCCHSFEHFKSLITKADDCDAGSVCLANKTSSRSILTQRGDSRVIEVARS